MEERFIYANYEILTWLVDKLGLSNSQTMRGSFQNNPSDVVKDHVCRLQITRVLLANYTCTSGQLLVCRFEAERKQQREEG